MNLSTETGIGHPIARGLKARRMLWSDDPRAALSFGAIGAIVGLTLAGYGLFTAQGTVIRGVPAEDVAVVNGIPILRSDLVAQAQSTLGRSMVTPQERRQLLDDMIREELLVQRGLELGEPGTDPDTRAALVAAVQQQVAVDATSEVPSEAQLRTFYAAHRAHYASMGAMTVRDLVPRTPGATTAASREAIAALKRGASPGSLGLKDSGRVDGEELYFAARIHLGDALFRVAAALPSNATAGPVDGPDGPHILWMTSNTPPVPKNFTMARNQVYNDYKEDLEARLRAGEYRYLRAKADIQIAQDMR